MTTGVGSDRTGGETETIFVSPTYLSTDLFTPFRDPRVTLPSIGEYRAFRGPQGGKTWGCPITEYGGIGNLTFLGCTKVRDLDVSRSHRHYKSGFYKYETDLQPYRVTSLKLSECRLNDQILPPPLHTDLTGHVRINNMWPQHHRYKTHVSKFEMFPRIDPERTEFDAPVIPQSRTKQELSEATNIAIERMTQTRYRNSLYDQTFVDFTKEAPAERNSVLTDSNNLSSTVESESGTECEDGAGNKDDEEQKSEDDDKSERDESEETVSMETKVPESFQTKKLEGEGCQATACPLHGRQHPIKSEKPINVNTRTDIATVISDTIVKMDSMAKSKLAGLAPCWPPSASYTIGKDSQLVERNTVDMYPAAYTSSLKPKNCTCQTYVANSLKKSESTTALVQHKPDIKIELPPVLKNKRPVAPFMLLPCVGDGAVQKVEWIKLPPEPLSSCLQPTGSRVPDRIGLRFRTEAHQRYHLTHPEPVPDLRALKTTHKKYFFYGYHASVFRG